MLRPSRRAARMAHRLSHQEHILGSTRSSTLVRSERIESALRTVNRDPRERLSPHGATAFRSTGPCGSSSSSRAAVGEGRVAPKSCAAAFGIGKQSAPARTPATRRWQPAARWATARAAHCRRVMLRKLGQPLRSCQCRRVLVHEESPTGPLALRSLVANAINGG